MVGEERLERVVGPVGRGVGGGRVDGGETRGSVKGNGRWVTVG